MKCLILFSVKNKKIVSTLSSAELAPILVKVKTPLLDSVVLIIRIKKNPQ